MKWPNDPAGLLDAMYGVRGRVGLVTGALSGIGLAAAKLCVANGMQIIGLDIKDEVGSAVTKSIDDERYSGSFQFRKLDVTDENACRRVVDAIAAEFGRIDCLFNSAGLSRRDADMDEDGRTLQWRVNVDGTRFMTEAAVPHMKVKRWGRIVNMGSVVGYAHIPFEKGSHYKSTKEWVHKCSAERWLELAPSGITVNAIAPGRVMTDLVLEPGKGWVSKAPDTVEAFRIGCASQRSGTMLLPEEVAFAVLGLFSRHSTHINGSVKDMSDCWGTAGHKEWPADEMPPEFYPFREYAQGTTTTPIMPKT